MWNIKAPLLERSVWTVLLERSSKLVLLRVSVAALVALHAFANPRQHSSWKDQSCSYRNLSKVLSVPQIATEVVFAAMDIGAQLVLHKTFQPTSFPSAIHCGAFFERLLGFMWPGNCGQWLSYTSMTNGDVINVLAQTSQSDFVTMATSNVLFTVATNVSVLVVKYIEGRRPHTVAVVLYSLLVDAASNFVSHVVSLHLTNRLVGTHRTYLFVFCHSVFVVASSYCLNMALILFHNTSGHWLLNSLQGARCSKTAQFQNLPGGGVFPVADQFIRKNLRPREVFQRFEHLNAVELNLFRSNVVMLLSNPTTANNFRVHCLRRVDVQEYMQRVVQGELIRANKLPFAECIRKAATAEDLEQCDVDLMSGVPISVGAQLNVLQCGHFLLDSSFQLLQSRCDWCPACGMPLFQISDEILNDADKNISDLWGRLVNQFNPLIIPKSLHWAPWCEAAVFAVEQGILEPFETIQVPHDLNPKNPLWYDYFLDCVLLMLGATPLEYDPLIMPTLLFSM